MGQLFYILHIWIIHNRYPVEVNWGLKPPLRGIQLLKFGLIQPGISRFKASTGITQHMAGVWSRSEMQIGSTVAESRRSGTRVPIRLGSSDPVEEGSGEFTQKAARRTRRRARHFLYLPLASIFTFLEPSFLASAWRRNVPLWKNFTESATAGPVEQATRDSVLRNDFLQVQHAAYATLQKIHNLLCETSA